MSILTEIFNLFNGTLSKRVKVLEEDSKLIFALIHRFQHNEDNIMATIQEVRDAAIREKAEVQVKLNAVAIEIQALRDQIANGGAATPEQLDELIAAITDIFTPVV